MHFYPRKTLYFNQNLCFSGMTSLLQSPISQMMEQNVKKHLRAHLLQVQGYVSAGMQGDKTAKKIFLNANENPYALPGLEGYNRYAEPQPAEMLNGFADFYGVQPDHIMMSRGADEAIVVITKLFVEPHQDSILISSPTFGMYKVDADMMPSANVVDVPLIKKQGDFFLNVDDIIQTAQNPDHNIKLVFLCSPNNPTGTVFPHDQLVRITEELKGHAMVVMDEAYAEFNSEDSLIALLNDNPHLIILRTLSKAYSLAGMRIGFALNSDAALISLMRDKGLDAYPIPQATIEAARLILKPEIQSIARENIKKLEQSRDALIAAMKDLKCVNHVYPSSTNFILVEMTDAQGFMAYTGQRNMILRDFSAAPGAQNCIRISVGTEEENALLLDYIKEFSEI